MKSFHPLVGLLGMAVTALGVGLQFAPNVVPILPAKDQAVAGAAITIAGAFVAWYSKHFGQQTPANPTSPAQSR